MERVLRFHSGICAQRFDESWWIGRVVKESCPKMCFVPSAARIGRLQRTLSAQLRMAKHAHSKGGKHSGSTRSLAFRVSKTSTSAGAEAAAAAARNNGLPPFPLGILWFRSRRSLHILQYSTHRNATTGRQFFCCGLIADAETSECYIDN